MRKLIRIFLFAVVLATTQSAARSQQVSNFETKIVDTFELMKADAFKLFYNGAMHQARDGIRSLVGRAPSDGAKIYLQRDLLQVCADSDDWRCVAETIQNMLPILKQNSELAKIMYPEVVSYETRLMQWHNNTQYVDNLLQSKGAPHSIANPITHPIATAELHLALNRHYTNKGDFISAEVSRSAAIHALLVSAPSSPFLYCKILIGLVASLLDAQDVVGAFALASAISPYVERSLPHRTVLYAEYKMLLGQLFSFTNAYGLAASTLLETAQLFGQLEMDADTKAYRIGTAHALAAAALVLANRLADARDAHSKHPMFLRKNEIIDRQKFQTYTDYFFGVVDVFLAAVTDGKPDLRWKPLFDQPIPWELPHLERKNIESYRVFSRGVLILAEGDTAEGNKLITLAARERIENFDAILRTNFESFQLPSLVDKILIGIGLASAIKTSASDAPELLLKGGELLGRNLRHQIVDVASMLARQTDAETRSEAHSYVHLIRQTRNWELQAIQQLLTNEKFSSAKWTFSSQYNSAISALVALKRQLKERVKRNDGLPNILDLQRGLREGETFITHFPVFGGTGKLCVMRNNAIYSASKIEPGLIEKIHQYATAVSTRPRSTEDLSEFPAISAIEIYNFLFTGIEACISRGTHVTITISPELAGIPFGALLRKEPPKTYEGYDLRKAEWLIRDVSFSTVISARHFLAILSQRKHTAAPKTFLGVGDPLLSRQPALQGALESKSAGSRGLALQQLARLDEIPETSDELKRVGRELKVPDSDILLRDQAREENFRTKLLSEYNVIHFATHGLIWTDLPGLTEAALVFTSGQVEDTYDDGVLTASEISRLSLNARLIVLSACNTASYNAAQATTAIQDLQAAFAVAGASTLLATLWSVHSEAARDIVIAFYKSWLTDQQSPTAPALARAVVNYLAGASRLRQHPWYWAPFIIAGDGEARAPSRLSPLPNQSTFGPMQGFESGGEILRMTGAGSDLVISMYGEWDGKKMNGIISRRSSDGVEKWRVSSRQIGSGTLTSNGDLIVAAGYTVEEDPTPVLRAFDGKGDLRWQTSFPELRGYSFDDLAATSDGLFIVAVPSFSSAPQQQVEAVLLLLSEKGDVLKRSLVSVDHPQRTIGRRALLRIWEKKTVLVFNEGARSKVKFNYGTPLGMPMPCFESGNANVYAVDTTSLTVAKIQSFSNLMITSLLPIGSDLIVGGETQADCLTGGTATISRLTEDKPPHLLWQSEDAFKSSISGLSLVRGQIVAAVRHERTLGIDTRPLNLPVNPAEKRWGDNAISARDSSFVFLSREGRYLHRKYLAAGFSIFIQGIETNGQSILAYGSMGGLPAYGPIQ